MGNRIALVHTYPVGHDCATFDEWLSRTWREQEIARYFVRQGLEVEVWAVHDDVGIRRADGVTYHIRRDAQDVPERDAAWQRTTHVVLKGLDGTFGDAVLKRVVLPAGMTHAYIIGGTPWTRRVRHARVVLYESAYQRDLLQHPARPWRRPVPSDRLLFLPKRVDLDAFRPASTDSAEFDAIVVSRLIRRYKDFSLLGTLDPSLRMAVMGDGDFRQELMSRHPHIHFLGHIPHARIPQTLSRARLFLHTSYKDYFPRAIAEAFASGLPVIAPTGGNVREDVVAADRGCIVAPDATSDAIRRLIGSEESRQGMAVAARQYAEQTFSAQALENALDAFLDRMKGP